MRESTNHMEEKIKTRVEVPEHKPPSHSLSQDTGFVLLASRLFFPARGTRQAASAGAALGSSGNLLLFSPPGLAVGSVSCARCHPSPEPPALGSAGRAELPASPCPGSAPRPAAQRRGFAGVAPVAAGLRGE